MKNKSPNKPRNKYSGILIAIACFLVFDLGVLVLNFYTSYEIGEDAVSINFVGRQRMRSERMLRTLLQMQSEGLLHGNGNLVMDREMNVAHESGNWLELSPREVLAATATLFDSTHKTLHSGGKTSGAWGETVILRKLDTPRGVELLNRIDVLWQPYHGAIKEFLETPDMKPGDMDLVVAHAQAGNVALQKVMNDLAKEMETVAEAKANSLRTVQTIGIIFALLNFAFIIFKFLRQLREQDSKIEQAQQETQEILGTVREGLFLLDTKYQICSQHSDSLQQILQREISTGLELMPMLQAMVPAAVFNAARGYLELLFGNRVKESLVGSLNPLSEVEVTLLDEDGKPETHFLSFRFNRVMQGKSVAHLLVTVQDVTERVVLQRQLADAKSNTRVEVDILLKLLQTDPEMLKNFLRSVDETLEQINDALRATTGRGEHSYQQLINLALRKIHACKGEAALLGIEMLETQAHEFEQQLLALRAQGNPSGDDMLGLSVALTAFFERLHMLENITERLTQFSNGQSEANSFHENLEALALRIAQTQNKQVHLNSALDTLKQLPQRVSSKLQHIAIQLLRNAITHGIEAPEIRTGLAKPPVGNINVSCHAMADGWYEFVLRDDGRGLSAERIRAVLIATGQYTEAEVAAMDEREVVMKIFEPGFTTETNAHTDAGHGAGMDVVLEKAKAIGGKLHLSTRENHYTEFRVRFLPELARA